MWVSAGVLRSAAVRNALKSCAALMVFTTLMLSPGVSQAQTLEANQFSCGVPQEIAWSDGLANVFTLALSRPTGVRIVLLGSSSTEGTGASKKDKTFARHLESELKSAWGKKRITIFNAGRGGETATRMMARLKKDVLRRKPHLVIWQTGVNDAMRRVDPVKFERLLREGIHRMRNDNIDVVLVDMQDFPRAARIKRYSEYLKIMDRVAQSEGVPLLHRFRIMKYLARVRPGGLKTLLAKDQFHMNDVSHKCIGQILADGLQSLNGGVNGVVRSSAGHEGEGQSKTTLKVSAEKPQFDP